MAMKRTYIKPAMRVVKIQQHGIICTSDWDVINPGKTNQPAGAPEQNNIWGEEW